jgi:hypothetical protein
MPPLYNTLRHIGKQLLLFRSIVVIFDQKRAWKNRAVFWIPGRDSMLGFVFL